MLYPVVFLIGLLSGLAAVSADFSTRTPMSVMLPAFSRECVYFDLKEGQDHILMSYQVLTGGNFEIDFEITAPEGNVIGSDTRSKYGDFHVYSWGVGQYSFCFTNSYGTALKKVEFTLGLQEQERKVEKEDPEDLLALDSIDEINRNFDHITKIMAYLRAREWRNMSTVKSTESRLVWLSVLTALVMIGVSAGQSIMVQFFFKDRHRNYV
ncbi:ADR026Wp [Eremothecium gossypii ATCC 10895]|uniref:ADR026Wp n=1 Tax=Eremothecium gossypii (strain ATCC 10895 / CBS 109.51 / FGSC 9923 / NRRL Y-1056) TaxID=284811 RepID=Q75A92_EREGS|nr:ADR026Wp [Eremothecium gossypii ATCC 10895]AAS51946.1 ADR026Wp [Eremothecium gossypii ATCC 10895]AEY96246.1 FADR026Wp [Eremothecium gossypii FDAG1]